MLETKTYIEIAKELGTTTTTLRKKMKQTGLS
jgi:predicted transcriptional regulator